MKFKLFYSMGCLITLLTLVYGQEQDSSGNKTETSPESNLPESAIVKNIENVQLVVNPCEDTAFKRLSNETWRDLSISDKNKLTKLSFECNEFNKGTNHGFREKEYGSKELFSNLGSFHHFMGSIVCISSVVGMVITANQNVQGSFWIYSIEGIALCTGIWEFKIGSKLKRYYPGAK
jgi:hypothetical protein